VAGAIGNRKSASLNPLGYPDALRAARFIRARSRIRPRVGIILGSGLSGALGSFRAARKISYGTIPRFPRTTVAGHAGVLRLGVWRKVPVAVLEGRMHLYEGYTPAEVAFPTRVLALAGIETLIATCAAGGISPNAVPGSFMIFSDHLNFQGANPLAGWHDARWGERFVDLSQAYDADLRRQAQVAARACHVKCFEGVYAALCGPNYETPAEIRALRRLGADAVGMSTVPEVLAARQAGLRVIAIATISNRAAGLSRVPLSHAGVLRGGKEAARNLARLLDALLEKMSES
jgi:purine-nucleoside phosphorylase